MVPVDPVSVPEEPVPLLPPAGGVALPSPMDPVLAAWSVAFTSPWVFMLVLLCFLVFLVVVVVPVSPEPPAVLPVRVLVLELSYDRCVFEPVALEPVSLVPEPLP